MPASPTPDAAIAESSPPHPLDLGHEFAAPTLLATALQLFVSASAAYAFAKMNMPFKRFFFSLYYLQFFYVST